MLDRYTRKLVCRKIVMPACIRYDCHNLNLFGIRSVFWIFHKWCSTKHSAFQKYLSNLAVRITHYVLIMYCRVHTQSVITYVHLIMDNPKSN